MKKHSISLAIKEMQIKMILRLHSTPGRMALIKKTSAAEDVQGKRNLIHYW
jgi:hypothetical protein